MHVSQDQIYVEKIDASNQDIVVQFLEKHVETSLFLLGNLEEHGPFLSESMNSGNYRMLVSKGMICAVYSMTRRGNVLIQSDGKDDYSLYIYHSVIEDQLPICGVVGAWQDANRFTQLIRDRLKIFKMTFDSKEILYCLSLEECEFPLPSDLKSREIRYLAIEDFNQWDLLNRAYLAEEKLTVQGTESQRHESFNSQTLSRHWWGLFQEEEMIAIAAYNAKYKNTGQIGGVFTKPEHRRKGYSQQVLLKMIQDSQKDHGVNRLILFTGERNLAAQGLYTKLGFVETNHFALIFGEDLKKESD